MFNAHHAVLNAFCSLGLDDISLHSTFYCNDWSIKIHPIRQQQLDNTPMSLLNLAKSAFTRPSRLSAFIAVGVALILASHGFWTYSDLLKHQPVTARKMHIQSIPMCKFV
jgi:hypothetical protein